MSDSGIINFFYIFVFYEKCSGFFFIISRDVKKELNIDLLEI